MTSGFLDDVFGDTATKHGCSSTSSSKRMVGPRRYSSFTAHLLHHRGKLVFAYWNGIKPRTAGVNRSLLVGSKKYSSQLHTMLVCEDTGQETCGIFHWYSMSRHTLVLHSEVCKPSRSILGTYCAPPRYSNQVSLSVLATMVPNVAVPLHLKCKSIYQYNKTQHADGFWGSKIQQAYFPKLTFH